MTTYFDKFADGALRGSIALAKTELGRELDIVDFCDSVCEPTILSMFKEYVFDRGKFLQSPPISEFSLSMIIAGATGDGEIRSYMAFGDGLTERIDTYGTIGSGAAYAELFLRFLLHEDEIDTEEAARLAVYAIKGVELMDPNVGGPVNLLTLKTTHDGVLECTPATAESDPSTAQAKDAMAKVLGSLTEGIELLIEDKSRIDLTDQTELKNQREPIAPDVVENGKEYA